MLGRGAQMEWSRGQGDEGGSVSIGLGGGDDVSAEDERAVQAALIRNLSPLIFTYRPGDDRLAFGNRFALHPLADSANRHYRYQSGDTLRIRLPAEERDVTLIEIQVEPRRSAFELLAGSLWFDQRTGDLVRAHYRPSRPFDLAQDDGEDVPGIFSPLRVDIEYLTVEYSLQELEWWLPRRFGIQGEVRAGRLLRAPLTADWSLSQILVNTDETLIPDEATLPEGWASNSGEWEYRDGSSEAVRIIAPPIDSLRRSPLLSEDPPGVSPVAFSQAEIDELKSDLEALTPAPPLIASGFAYGLADRNLRYNRVEGLSVGASTQLAVGPRTVVEPRIRYGVLDQQIRGSLGLHWGDEGDRWSLVGSRRLAHTDDFGDPLALGASLSNLVFRNGHTQFYGATGVELRMQKGRRALRADLRAFGERHDALMRETNFYLWKPITGDTLPSVFAAEEGSIFGLGGDLRWQLGTGTGTGSISGLLRGEAAVGDLDYQRLSGSLAFRRDLIPGLSGAVEIAAGSTWGNAPIQKHFFLGGAHTLRGYSGSFTHGERFWMARAELGTSLPAARLTAFSDLGLTGPRDRWPTGRALWSAGGGLSFLDGLIRMDAAWPIRAASGGRFYLYLDGLF